MVNDSESGVSNATGCGATTIDTDTTSINITCSATNGVGLTTSDTITIMRDATAPTISFGAAETTFLVTDDINITCNASDATSGIATAACPEIVIAAAKLAVGTHELVATAEDHAGNATTKGHSFTTIVTYDALCELTRRYTSDHPIADALCARLETAEAADEAGATTAADHVTAAYSRQIDALRSHVIAPDDAATPIRLAQSL